MPYRWRMLTVMLLGGCKHYNVVFAERLIVSSVCKYTFVRFFSGDYNGKIGSFR